MQRPSELGRGQLADFPRLRIDPDMLVVRALKISQLIRQLPDGMPPTYDSVH